MNASTPFGQHIGHRPRNFTPLSLPIHGGLGIFAFSVGVPHD